MAKRSQFVCQQCGYSQVGWAGKCPNCGTWGSLVETIISTNSKSGKNERKSAGATPISLSSIKSKNTERISTKISELDRAIGGGLVPGQVILLAGEPGIGKSTLLLQLASKLGQKILYISGEESANQIKIRADRLKIEQKNLLVAESTDIDSVAGAIEDGKYAAAFVDSIQTMATGDLSGMAGSVGQVRECSNRLVRVAKQTHTPIFIVGHVTKEGSVAGPAALAHIVDTVLWFEGDRNLSLRMLRAFKNRFGPTDEVGIFQMEEEGLAGVEEAGKLFLSESTKSVSGSVVASLMEGTRPILVEIQSLVVPTKLAFPRRIAQGIDSRRLEVILAVLARRCGVPVLDSDVFVNVVGGIKVTEPSADLAVALSIASAYFDKAINRSILVFGEVGLLGEVRKVTGEARRIKEAKRLGFKGFITPQNTSFVREAIKTHLK